jgi:hypothetical protein
VLLVKCETSLEGELVVRVAPGWLQIQMLIKHSEDSNLYWSIDLR